MRWNEGLESGSAARSARDFFPHTEAMTHFARGLAAARLGDVANAQTSHDALIKIHEQLLKSKKFTGRNRWRYSGGRLCMVALAEGHTEDALQEMKSAAKLEDGTEKSAVTPGRCAFTRTAG